MARLIPKMEVDDIGLKPERDVARQLVEQLPEDCVVYHSYPWLKAERNDRQGKDTLREGEADFVIVDPRNGLLVLEVKGGEIEYDSASHCWYRRVGGGRRKQINDPFEQARRNTHYLEEHIRERSFAMRNHLPCAYGYAVVFPDCTYSGALPGGSDHAIILSGGDLPYIGRRIPEILRKWSRVKNPGPLTREELNGIVQGLSPCLQLMPVLVRRLEDQEEQLVRLTAEQLRLLDFLAMHERAAIQGVAGSGKTLLARAQAQRFADAGKRTLFVCYNRALAEWLRASMPEAYEDRIVVRHFHGLCSDFCRKVSIPFAVPDKDQDQFWKYKAPDLFTQALDLTTERFDAVVADEGQDFYPDWWLPLEMINQEGDQGPFYIFYDPAQNLFVQDELSIPSVGRPFELPTNCRNKANRRLVQPDSGHRHQSEGRRARRHRMQTRDSRNRSKPAATLPAIRQGVDKKGKIEPISGGHSVPAR